MVDLAQMHNPDTRAAWEAAKLHAAALGIARGTLVLCPTLTPADVVILDNPASHKVGGVQPAIMACRVTRFFICCSL